MPDRDVTDAYVDRDLSCWAEQGYEIHGREHQRKIDAAWWRGCLYGAAMANLIWVIVRIPSG